MTFNETSAIIDCRSKDEFCKGHLHHACHIPLVQLPHQMHQLPDTSTPLVVCGHQADLIFATNFLQEKGYQVLETIIWQESMTEVADCESQRLWQASPLIQKFVQELMPNIITNGRKGLDLACGAGRDTVFLAMNDWQMTGIDYRQETLDRAQQLATSQKVTIQTECRDLESTSQPLADMAHASFDLITVARYLHRPLFPTIHQLLAPKGILLYHTFMTGSEAFGSPKNPNFLLRYGELAQICCNDHVLWNEVIKLPDGRPMSFFAAQKSF